MREITKVTGRAYGRTNLRDVLVSLDEHPVENSPATEANSVHGTPSKPNGPRGSSPQFGAAPCGERHAPHPLDCIQGRTRRSAQTQSPARCTGAAEHAMRAER